MSEGNTGKERPRQAAPQGLSPAEQRRGMIWMYYYSAFNALSFEVIGGQILILFARQVGASLMQIGLLASFLPFATVIQLAVAPLVNKFGPNAVVLTGWTSRSVVACFLLLVPAVAAHYGPVSATNMLLLIMALFYLFRALGMSSWLPLLQEIVPPHLRGDYLGKQEILRHLSIISVSLLTAFYLIGAKDLRPFLHVLVFGIATAFATVFCLHGLPYVQPSKQPVNREFFRQMLLPLKDPAFRRYLNFSSALRLVIGSTPSFIILFMRDQLGLGASHVLFINTLCSLGAALSLLVWGRMMDRFGSKPALLFGVVGTFVTALLWATIGPKPWTVRLLLPFTSLLQGIFNAGLMVGMSRLELHLIPRPAREHYVAATVTIAGIATGLSPLIGGALLHHLEHTALRLGTLALNAYQVYFLASALTLILPFFLRIRLQEKPSHNFKLALHGFRLRAGKLLRH